VEAVISFESVSHAIQAEQFLLEAGFQVKVMPVPSSLKPGCGFCLRLPYERIAEACGCLGRNGVSRSDVFLRDENGEFSAYVFPETGVTRGER
jgi:hypothetical protein